MSDLIAALLEPLIGLCWRIGRLFCFFFRADDAMKENSVVGESEMDREARRSWGRWGAGCLLLLILAAVAAGMAFWWSQ